jgi:hypothetical protein
MKIFESCIRYLDECNFFSSFVPLCTLQSPEQVVETGIVYPSVCAGISIGGRWTRVYVPDVLLGFIDEDYRWHWADAENVCAVNLHSVRHKTDMLRQTGWPVWLTITDHQVRARLQQGGAPRIDLLRILQRYKARCFWKESLEEFIRITWHPSRLHWCLDTEDRGFFYGDSDDPEEKNHMVCHVHANNSPRRGELPARSHLDAPSMRYALV